MHQFCIHINFSFDSINVFTLSGQNYLNNQNFEPLCHKWLMIPGHNVTALKLSEMIFNIILSL